MPHITVNGTGIEYAEYGSKLGTPFLLISGYTRQMTGWPDELIDGLVDAGHRVIIMDNRDIGLSEQFDDRGIPNMTEIVAGLKSGTAAQIAPYVLNDMADDAAGLLEALDATPAIVMGASMGGMITQLVALRHPDKVSAIIPTMTTSGAPGLPAATPEAQAMLTKRPATPSRRAIMDQAIESRKVIGSSPELSATPEEIGAQAGSDYDRAYRPGGIIRQYAAIVAQPRWHDALADLNVPTLVLHGEIDPLIPAPCGKDIADRVPGAKYVEIPGWGHDTPPKAVPLLLAQILPFVASLKVDA